MHSGPEQIAQQWIRRFRLSEDELVTIPELFPELDDSTSSLSLDQMCRLVSDSGAVQPSVAEALELYKIKQEFSSARRLLDLRAGLDTVERREVEKLHEQAIAQWEPRLNAVHAQVGELGKLSVSDQEVEEMKLLVDQSRLWLRRGRVGRVQETLSAIQERVQKHVGQTSERLTQQVADLHLRAEALPYERRVVVERLLAVSRERLRQQELRLAENACERAAIALQGGELPAETLTTIQPVRRMQVMPLGVAHLLDILESESVKSHPGVDNWEQFVETWEITPLRTSSGRNVREALQWLYVAKAEPAMRLGDEAPWPKFLRKFFECLLVTPVLGGFQQLAQNMGAFVPLSSRISLPGSFFDANPEQWKAEPLVVACTKPRESVLLVQQLATRNLSLRGRLVLVLTSEPVAKQHRDDLRASFNTHGAMSVLLDEQTILSILCAADPQERSLRFVATVARQLPGATINPFRSDNAVSEGMFFGREEEIHELLSSTSSFAVFGGRKLGKTSLLKKVEREWERQDDKSIAIWLDIRNFTTAEEVQGAILSELKQPRGRKTWKDRFSSVDPSLPFRDQMEKLIAAHPDHRFLFLLDEADGFMQRLATDPDTQHFGWTLRSLCSAEPRVRFIFAGFQELYRACREALEGPWYNFIKLLELKVLEEDAARELVVRTLGLLGLYFKAPELVYRILDYTSCHASLVQEFCHRLFLHVVDDYEPGVLGTIESKHVEAVFNDPDFRTAIDRTIQVNVSGENRTKRSLKLVLYAWVYRLMNPTRADQLQEVLTARELYEFLEEQFGADTISQAITFEQVDAFLHDLLVLGVLDRFKEGHKYYLRNRHFARMLNAQWGTQRLAREVRRLLDLVGTETGEKLRRLWARSKDGLMREFSPFTRDDEQLWRTTSASTILILGGPAMGKTWALRWIKSNLGVGDSGPADLPETCAQPQVKEMDLASASSVAEGMVTLARALKARSSSWDDIAHEIQAWASSRTRENPAYLLIDNADSLSDLDFLIGTGKEDGLFERIYRLSDSLKGSFRLVLTGSARLARIWVDWGTDLRGMVVGIPLRRLTSSEVTDWAEGNRLFGVVGDELHRLTGGHPYLLRRFYASLNSAGAERTVVPRDLVQFRAQLESPGPLRDEVVSKLFAPTDPKMSTLLGLLRETCQTLEVQDVDVTLVEMVRDQRKSALPQVDWVSEARVLAVLDELEPQSRGSDSIIGRIRPSYPWQRDVTA